VKELEIINVRLSDRKDEAELLRIFHDLLSRPGVTADRTFLFRRSGVDTDWSIHLCRPNSSPMLQKSRLGHCLAEALRTLGMVNHSVWIDVKVPGRKMGSSIWPAINPFTKCAQKR